MNEIELINKLPTFNSPLPALMRKRKKLNRQIIELMNNNRKRLEAPQRQQKLRSFRRIASHHHLVRFRFHQLPLYSIINMMQKPCGAPRKSHQIKCAKRIFTWWWSETVIRWIAFAYGGSRGIIRAYGCHSVLWRCCCCCSCGWKWWWWDGWCVVIAVEWCIWADRSTSQLPSIHPSIQSVSHITTVEHQMMNEYMYK